MNEYLKKAREAIGFNKVQMGEALGITSTYYGMIENGIRSLQPKHYKIIVDELGVRRAWLDKGELPILKREENEDTLAEFMKLNGPQQQLVLEMIRQFNELNEAKK